MCRRNHLHGCCAFAFGLGLMIGYCLESWFLCSAGGIAIILFGVCLIRQK